MWAQNWESLFSVLLPNALVSGEEATQVLRKHFSSFSSLAEVVEDFFLSIGFQHLPSSFWRRSQFVKPQGRKTVCHGSATDFFYEDDVR